MLIESKDLYSSYKKICAKKGVAPLDPVEFVWLQKSYAGAWWARLSVSSHVDLPGGKGLCVLRKSQMPDYIFGVHKKDSGREFLLSPIVELDRCDENGEHLCNHRRYELDLDIRFGLKIEGLQTGISEIRKHRNC